MLSTPVRKGLFLSTLILLAGTLGCPRTTPNADAVCGNGVLESGEACDDGNTVSGDGCSATCTTEASATCGNGTLEDGEECDDGNTRPGDGCSATCTTETSGVCGDGHVDSGEQCDDGTANSDSTPDACRTDCTVAKCGDGVVDANEACDDGNDVAGDGCERDCTLTNAATECSTPAPISSGTCEVTAGTNGNVLITADLLTPTGIMKGGQMVVDASGTITCVSCDCSTEGAGATTIVCPSGVVSPGLINSHDHITYAQNDPYTIARDERFEQRHDWRKGLRGHTKIPAAGGASKDEILWGELRFLMGGATSTDGSGSAAGFLRNLDKTDQDGLNQKPVDYNTFPLDDSDGTQLESGCDYGTIDTPDRVAGDDAYVPHVAEGIDAVARNEFLCVSSSSNGGEDLLAPQSAFIHAVGLSPADYALMAQTGTGLIWSPRSNVTLYGDTAKVTEAARAGVRIALGTDWMPTGSMNMERELQCADNLNKNYFGGFFSDRELWLMATEYGAELMAVDDVVGSLQVGKVADLAIFDGSAHAGYRAVIDAQPQDVVLVLRGGTPLYGDASIIDALATGCDGMDVCGTTKALCAQADIGKTFSALQTAVGNDYPLFFCGTPDNEPSCTPMRNETVTGSSLYTGAITADDEDGDGIANADDDCPTVFNPIRPNDGGKQADADADGLGDVCDPCPLDANTTQCSTVDPNDMDNDGVPAAQDNCPDSANADQADADQDGKGDVCDACPNVANPGAEACPVSIYAIKEGNATGTVAVENAIVTACAPGAGYFVQVSESDPDYQGAANSGLYVYDHGDACAAGLLRGDQVTINPATVSVWYQQIELTAPVTNVIAHDQAIPAPVALTPAEAAGTSPNGYEGVLATVSSATVTDIAPAPGGGDSAPTGEYVVDDALRVDNFMYEVDPFPVVGATYTSITGVLAFKNDNQKLEPRDAADYVVGAPVLVGFGPATTFTRIGAAPGATIPEPLTVTLSSPAQGATTIALASSDASSLTVSDVTIPDGATSAEVPVQGLLQAQAVTLTATLGTTSLTAAVRVLGDAEQPVPASIDPNPATVMTGGTQTFTVTLDIPAPAAGADVALAADATVGSVPATVTIPANAMSATFDLAAATAAGTGQITATLNGGSVTTDVTLSEVVSGLVINEVDYDQDGTDTGEFVEIYNGSGATVDLAGKALVLVNGSNNTPYDTVDLSQAGATLAPGAYLVVGSNTAIQGLGCATIAFAKAADNVQNGSPDGMALVDTNQGELLDALSYEGSITSTTITGVGQVSLVEGTATTAADANTGLGSVARLPNGSDTDDAATDWAFTATPTPCAANQ